MPRWKECRHPPFLSTLSLRRATLTTVLHWYHISRFLSTLSLRRATRSGGPWQAGCRDFYPRSPCGERPCSASRYFSMPSYFYPRSPCGERLSFIIYSITDNCISIHALLAESDIELAFLAINPITFLSTLSLRRATPGAKSTTPERYYFYPRSPCGERLFIQNYNAGVGAHFYPRSPCGERRPPGGGLLRSIYFYPRSPCGERQGHPSRIPWRLCISIHALLAESDLAPQVVGVVLVKFLSTLSLRRATLVFTARQAAIGVFLSTLSLRRATFLSWVTRVLP